ncbi:hypothetical protein L2E82_21588 [Cichorium intybus]|uniref:Uncharacterized protein n=1 Tax=Cichorium intybus TaxID=13427 RepID=A0ACB9DVL9_CICIN|nr:hypothetical protein L2E82_21588 [Cichorium intybus]
MHCGAKLGDPKRSYVRSDSNTHCYPEYIYVRSEVQYARGYQQMRMRYGAQPGLTSSKSSNVNFTITTSTSTFIQLMLHNPYEGLNNVVVCHQDHGSNESLARLKSCDSCFNPHLYFSNFLFAYELWH